MANQGFDLLLADIFMPHMMGLELVRAFREVSPDTIPMLITGYASVETAKAAVELGIYDNILKPFERDGLCAAVVKALDRKRHTDEKPQRKESIKPSRDGETTIENQEHGGPGVSPVALYLAIEAMAGACASTASASGV